MPDHLTTEKCDQMHLAFAQLRDFHTFVDFDVPGTTPDEIDRRLDQFMARAPRSLHAKYWPEIRVHTVSTKSADGQKIASALLLNECGRRESNPHALSSNGT